MTDTPPSDHDLLIEIRTKLDVHLEAIGKLTTDHEGRLRALERKLWGLSGAAAILGTAGGAGLTKVLHGA